MLGLALQNANVNKYRFNGNSLRKEIRRSSFCGMFLWFLFLPIKISFVYFYQKVQSDVTAQILFQTSKNFDRWRKTWYIRYDCTITYITQLN